MSDCSMGRVFTRTGSLHRVPAGMTCDDHPHLPAAKRVQGETDSFGCEYIDMCQTCYDKYVDYLRNAPPRECTYDPYD